MNPGLEGPFEGASAKFRVKIEKWSKLTRTQRKNKLRRWKEMKEVREEEEPVNIVKKQTAHTCYVLFIITSKPIELESPGWSGFEEN